MRFKADADREIRIISRKVRAGTYKFTPYRQILSSKGALRPPRIISIPSVRDRLTLRMLAELLVGVFPKARGVIPQVAIRRLAVEIDAGRFDSYVKVDIENFYPSISHELLLSRLARRIRSRRVLALIELAIETPTLADGPTRPAPPEKVGVPQGLAVSNVLSEIFMGPLDDSIKSIREIFFVRFVDDVLILCSAERIAEIENTVDKLFQENGLTVHPRGADGGKTKSGSLVEGFGFLGYEFRGGGVGIGPTGVSRLERSLAKRFSDLKAEANGWVGEKPLALARAEWAVNLRITGCVYRNVARGWVQYYRQASKLEVFKELDLTVARLAERSGAPDSLVLKKFMATYWRVNHPMSGPPRYIPNFDTYSEYEMRRLLSDVARYDNVDNLNQDEVKYLYFQFLDKEVAELDKDIGRIS